MTPQRLSERLWGRSQESLPGKRSVAQAFLQTISVHPQFFHMCDEIIVLLALLAFAGIYRRLDFQHNVDRFQQGRDMTFQPSFAERQVGGLKSVERDNFSLRRAGLDGLGKNRCSVIDQILFLGAPSDCPTDPFAAVWILAAYRSRFCNRQPLPSPSFLTVTPIPRSKLSTRCFFSSGSSFSV